MNSPIVSNTITTIPANSGAPTAEAAPGEATGTEGEGAPPASPETTATPGVAPAAGAKDPYLEVSKRFEGVAKKEARARRLETELQTKLSSAAEREKQIEAKLAELEAALEDPVKYYLDKGKDPVEVVKRFAKPETEESKKLRLIEERLAKREAEEERQKEEWETRQAAGRRDQAMRSFVGSISPKECPNLTNLYEAREVPKLVDELLNRSSSPGDSRSPTLLEAFRMEHDRAPTDAEIKECLEYEAELRATRILEGHRARQAQASAQVAQVSEERPSPQASAKADTGPRGISNQHAATTSTGKTRPKTLEERRRQKREELTAALEAEAASRRGDE